LMPYFGVACGFSPITFKVGPAMPNGNGPTRIAGEVEGAGVMRTRRRAEAARRREG